MLFLLRLRRTPTSVRLLSVRQLSKKSETYPINHNIPFDVVQLQESDGKLHSASLNHILSSLDKSTHLVRLVSRTPPIVRVLSHLEDKMNKLERKAELKARKNKGQVSTKEVRLTWLTSGADYEHKVAMARKELERGDIRIDFLFSPKAGVRAPPRFEMAEHMGKVADAFRDVSNEWKEMGFIGRGMARLFLQSTTPTTPTMRTTIGYHKIKDKLFRGRICLSIENVYLESNSCSRCEQHACDVIPFLIFPTQRAELEEIDTFVSVYYNGFNFTMRRQRRAGEFSVFCTFANARSSWYRRSCSGLAKFFYFASKHSTGVIASLEDGRGFVIGIGS